MIQITHVFLFKKNYIKTNIYSGRDMIAEDEFCHVLIYHALKFFCKGNSSPKMTKMRRDGSGLENVEYS